MYTKYAYNGCTYISWLLPVCPPVHIDFNQPVAAYEKPSKPNLPSDVGIFQYFQMWQIPCLKMNSMPHLSSLYILAKLTLKIKLP